MVSGEEPVAGRFALSDVGVGDVKFNGVVAYFCFFYALEKAVIILATVNHNSWDKFFTDDDGRETFCGAERVPVENKGERP